MRAPRNRTIAHLKTSIDCIPCFLRQTLDAARLMSGDPAVHERIVREALRWAGEFDFDQPPPAMGQRLHRRLREMTGNPDPYLAAKQEQNRMALSLLGALRAHMDGVTDALQMAARIAVAGNVIDMGVGARVDEEMVRRALAVALGEPLQGEWDAFARAARHASSILYLADNAGEIVFDRLLIEHLAPERVTLVVRGAPVLNDVTLDDVGVTGLPGLVEIIDNGSDAPGTLLADCSPAFRRRFEDADMVIAKGQGNYETLSDAERDVHFLFKAKCAVIASHAGVPQGAHVVARTRNASASRGVQ